MVNGQLIVVKRIHAVLAGKQVTHVQVVTAKLDVFLVMKVVLGHTYTWHVYGQAF